MKILTKTPVSENEVIKNTSTSTQKTKTNVSEMNAISFVTTKTNGDVLNKLSGAGGGQDVTVEITKSNSDQQIKISITIKSS